MMLIDLYGLISEKLIGKITEKGMEAWNYRQIMSILSK